MQNSSNLSWSLFEIPISIPKSPMKIKFSYISLALTVNLYLFKSLKETVEKGVKYVQSQQ